MSKYNKALNLSMHIEPIRDIMDENRFGSSPGSLPDRETGIIYIMDAENKTDEMIPDEVIPEEMILKELTTEEKINLVHGTALFHNGDAKRVGIPSLIMSDGPLGVRFDFKDDAWERINEDVCKCSWLVSGTALACTWNTHLAYETGNILGMEARGRGKDIILAPGINIHRTPLCGRCFEYMSEDPYLTGMIAAEEIKGIQSNDVAACVKHYALNNQETDRMDIDVRASERALYEIYLPAFEAALLQADSYSVMCSYNRFRGDHASANKYLLTDILRRKWNYDGVVISDWGAVHDTAGAYEAGVDIEMDVRCDFDNYFFAAPLSEAIKAGLLSEDKLDEKVLRILKLLRKIKKPVGKAVNSDGSFIESVDDFIESGDVNQEQNGGRRKSGAYNLPSSHDTLLEAAREAIVLLKNENNILPLDADRITNIAVIGDGATRKLAPGGGSSEIDALFEITPLHGISMVAGSSCNIHYAKGYSTDENDELQNKKLLNESIELAKKCDVVIYAGGLNRSQDTEGADKASYELPYGQSHVISELIKANKNTIVYINAGSAVDMSGFAQNAPAICYSSMIGMMGGLALAEILFGKANPSGKLSVSFPAKFSDCPAQNMDGNYSEGIYVGYRYYETRKVKPLFCFGHGLSYTTFEYSDIRARYIEGDGNAENTTLYEITCKVKNTGHAAGKEVAQLYVTPLNNTPERPVLELKGFDKISLLPGEEKEVSFVLKTSAFAYYSTHDCCYRADAGVYRINIGSSCEDIRLSTDISLSHDYFTQRMW